MRRRTLLRAGAGVLAGTAVGRVAAQEQDGYEPMGSVEIPGAKEAAITDDGEIAYVAAGDGFVTVDLSDPAAPAVLNEERGIPSNDPLDGIWDLWPDGDRLVVAGPANRTLATPTVLLYDVSDPANPVGLDLYEPGYPIHNTFFEDGIVYLTQHGDEGNPIALVDTADDELTELGRWSLLDHEDDWSGVSQRLYPIHDIYVQGDLAYLSYWDAGVWVLDVSDPSAPEYVNHFGDYSREELESMSQERSLWEPFASPGNAHYCQLNEDGTVLGVSKEAWTTETEEGEVVGGPGGIDLWDVTDPTDPERLSRIEPPESADNTQQGQFTTAHNFDLVGDRLYSSWYFGGVKVHDVSDPANPAELVWWREPDEAVFWTAQIGVPGDFFVGSSGESDGGFQLASTGALYTFPDEAGEQASPPSLVDSSATGSDQDDDSASENDEDTEDDSASENDEDTEDDTDGDDGSTESDDDSIPGFGVGAGVAGIGLAAWRHAARSDDGE